MKERSSRIKSFYKKSVEERRETVSEFSGVVVDDFEIRLAYEEAEKMVENFVGVFEIPMGLAPNFRINGIDYIVPMATEEPSVIAAAANAARLLREGDGLEAWTDESIMTGQIQLLGVEDVELARKRIELNRQNIFEKINNIDRNIVKRGGGIEEISTRVIETDIAGVGDMFIFEFDYDTCNAMGANKVNSVAEGIAPYIAELSGGRVNLRILTNLSDKRKAYAEGKLRVKKLFPGDEEKSILVAKNIVAASVFAELDEYRAATSNKGVMNGIDAVVTVTGNDTRAIEAGAHAYSVQDGKYTSLTKWRLSEDQKYLNGNIELPMAVGVVGGATKTLPQAKLALKILKNPDASELGSIIASVGLAQNFAANLALASEGIQNGHMSLHNRKFE